MWMKSRSEEEMCMVHQINDLHSLRNLTVRSRLCKHLDFDCYAVSL